MNASKHAPQRQHGTDPQPTNIIQMPDTQANIERPKRRKNKHFKRKYKYAKISSIRPTVDILRSHYEETGSCLEKEIMQGTMPGARRRGRPRTAWMDNIKTWTGLSVEESVRMTEDRGKWRKYADGVGNPTDRGRLTQQNTVDRETDC